MVECSSVNVSSISSSPSRIQGTSQKSGWRECKNWWMGRRAGQDMAVGHTNSQQIWSPAQNMYSIKPVKMQTKLLFPLLRSYSDSGWLPREGNCPSFISSVTNSMIKSNLMNDRLIWLTSSNHSPLLKEAKEGTQEGQKPGGRN